MATFHREGGLKTDKTFPPFDPRSGTGLDRNYRKLRFPGHSIKGGGGKGILCDGSFAEFLRSRSTLYVQPSPDAEGGGVHGEFYSSVRGGGNGRGFPAPVSPLPLRHEERKFELIKRLPYGS